MKNPLKGKTDHNSRDTNFQFNRSLKYNYFILDFYSVVITSFIDF